MMQFRRCQLRHREGPIGRQAVINQKGGRQTGPCNDPCQQPIAFQMRSLCDHSYLAT